MPKKMLLFILTCLLTLASALQLYASEPGQANAKAEAVKLLDQGRSQEAYDLLKQMYEKANNDTETAFMLGQAAMKLNRPGEAVRLYEEILANDPKLPRVRLELGRAYTAMGELQKAKDLFRTVLSESPPPAVGENILKYLGSLESQKPWNLRLSAGYVYDSNVNAGPTGNTILMFGLPFQLSNDSVMTGDYGYNASLGIGHQLPLLRNMLLQSDIQYNRTEYAKMREYNSDVFSISSGPTLRNDSFIVSMPLIFEHAWVNKERYSRAVGIGPQIMAPITQKLSANASWTGQLKEYFVNGGMRDGNIWSASVGARYDLWERGYLQASWRHTDEKTKYDYLDNQSNGVNAGLYSGLPAGFAFYLSSGGSKTGYDAREAAFTTPREDSQYTAVANISKEFGTTGLSAAVGYSYTRNDSSLSLYDYRRSQVTAQLSYSH